MFPSTNILTVAKIKAVSGSDLKAASLDHLTPFHSASPTHPSSEIQMINKFYGLIPKKYLITERIKPQILKQKCLIRPKTSQPRLGFVQSKSIGNGEGTRDTRIQRASSVDETRGRLGSTELSTRKTPLIARRISLDRPIDPSGAEPQTPEDTLASESALIGGIVKSGQRTIRIDLSRIRWDYEDDVENEEELVETLVEKVQHPSASTEEKVNPDTENECPDLTCDSLLVPWTHGKTTSERRSKLESQKKTFSIHPSFQNIGMEMVEAGEGEGEIDETRAIEIPDTLIKSKVRRGRSLHVESPIIEDIETMVSRQGKSRKYRSLDDMRQIQPIPQHVTTAITISNSINHKSKINSESLKSTSGGMSLEVEDKGDCDLRQPLPADFCGTEKRKWFKKRQCNSLPIPEMRTEVKVVINSTHHHHQMTRSRCSTTKGESGMWVGGGGGGKNEVVGLVVPPTSTTTTTTKSLLPNPRIIKSNSLSGCLGRNQFLKNSEINLQSQRGILSGKKKKVQFNIQTTKKEIEDMKKVSPKLIASKLPNKNDFKGTTLPDKGKLEVEIKLPSTEIPRIPSKNQSTPIPKRKFSLDEITLMNFSTTAGRSFDNGQELTDDFIEDSMQQSSKRRQECLKIYEKMKNEGYSLRLQTIFRGLMTPCEYRLFVSDVEKAATTTPNPTDPENLNLQKTND